MTQISGSLMCVTEKPAAVSEVWVRAPELRATAGAVITTDPDRYPVTSGEVSFPCAPGPAVLVLIAGGMPIATVPIVVADGEAMSLQAAVTAAELADTSTVSQLEQLAAEAVQAVVDARAEAGRAAAVLSTKADLIHTHTVGQVDGLQSALDGKAALVGGLIPTSQLPAVALTKPQVVSDRAGMLALTAQEGDVAVITSGTDKGTYMLGPGASTNFASWVALAAPTDAVTSVNGQTGVVQLAAGDVGAAPSSHTHTSAQVSDATAAATASMVMKRDSAGRAQVADPAAAKDIANKGWVDANKAQKLNDAWAVYTTDGNGNVVPEKYATGATPNTFVYRDVSGNFSVNTPVWSDDAAPKSYVDSGGTASEVTLSMWGATWYFTKVGKTVFVSTNGVNISTKATWTFTTPIPEGYRPKYQQRLHFGDGTAACNINPDGSLHALANYSLPVSFSYLAA